MKKYTIILIAALVGFSAQGAYRQVLPKLAQLGHSTRSKVTVAALAQIHKTLPLAAIKNSPLMGAANVLNGTTAYHLQQPDNTLHKSFFNKLPNEPVRFTVAPGNIATGLTPAMLGQLLKLHNSGDLYKKEFFQSSLYENWFASYKKLQPTKEEKYFKREVNKLLRLMREEKDQEKVQELLVSAVYFQGNTQQDVEDFLQQAGVQRDVTVRDTQDSQLMEQYAQAFVQLTVQEDFECLQAQEIREMAGFCAEKALWSFFNMIFFDTESKCLSLAMLPESVQATMLPACKDFICKHHNPKIAQYYRTAHADFLKLVHGIKGVRYLRGSAEIPGECSETLKILNHLFGTSVQSFVEFAKLVSTDRRTLTVSDLGEQKYGTMVVSSQFDDQKISGKWCFESVHVYFVFDKKEKNKMAVSEIMALEDQCSTPGRLIKIVPGYVHRIVDWTHDTVDQVSEKLDKYKISKEELNTLSQGLEETKCTLLHTALKKCRPDLVIFLLQQGMDPNFADSNGDRPLALVLRSNMLPMLPEKKKQLRHDLELYGADITLIPWFMYHIIDWEKDSVEKVSEVLKKYALTKTDLNSLQESLMVSAGTALFIAVEKRRPDLVNYFLDLGIDPNLCHYQNRSSYNPLLEAVMNKDCEIIKLLHARGADLNVVLNAGAWTPLGYATYLRDDVQLVTLLLALGADPNLCDERGCSSLIGVNNAEVMQALIKAGGNVMHTTKKGETPYSSSYKKEVKWIVLKEMIMKGLPTQVLLSLKKY